MRRFLLAVSDQQEGPSATSVLRTNLNMNTRVKELGLLFNPEVWQRPALKHESTAVLMWLISLDLFLKRKIIGEMS